MTPNWTSHVDVGAAAMHVEYCGVAAMPFRLVLACLGPIVFVGA
jgi:hypothetical protein